VKSGLGKHKFMSQKNLLSLQHHLIRAYKHNTPIIITTSLEIFGVMQ